MTVERVQTAMPKSFHFTLVFIFQQVTEQNKSLLAIVFHKNEPLLGKKINKERQIHLKICRKLYHWQFTWGKLVEALFRICASWCHIDDNEEKDNLFHLFCREWHRLFSACGFYLLLKFIRVVFISSLILADISADFLDCIYSGSRGFNYNEVLNTQNLY